jgi:hypothetical protein
MVEPRVRVFIDDHEQPVREHTPPAHLTIDSRSLADGEHRLRIEASDSAGQSGVRIVPFIVRNGPGITVAGLDDGATVHGAVSFHVNVFSATEPFEVRRAESRSPAPIWIWVLGLVISAWSAWYLFGNWNPPPAFAKTPTYAQSE